MKDITPGPVYSSNYSQRYKASPRYSFGTRSFPNFEGPRPGPTSYHIPSTLGYGVIGYRGSRAAQLRGRYDIPDYSSSPGPGAYNASFLLTRSAPAASFKGRNYPPAPKMLTPGPGAYNVTSTCSESNNSPRFTIGTKHSSKALPFFTLADVSD